MKKQVVIAGGGIVGLCCAYFLQKEGHQVTLIEKSAMPTGASYVNAGYLVPSHIIPLASPGMLSRGLRYLFDPSSPFYIRPRWDIELFRWAWYFKRSATKTKVEHAIPILNESNILSRELFFGIKASGDLGNFHLERKGLLMIYQTEKERDHELKIAEKAKSMGIEVDDLDGSALRKIEPNVAIEALGALHYHSDAHTTPSIFMEQMLNHLKNNGVIISQGEEIQNIVHHKGRITKMTTRKKIYEADEFILATGSWTPTLARQLNLNISLQAGKGYSIDVKKNTGITMPAILMEAKVAVTPMKGFTRFAGTMEFSGVNNTLVGKRVDTIVDSACRFYKDLVFDEFDKTNAKCGLRPVSPDGLPYVGKPRALQNLIVATGHAMMGWSLGPITGKVVSEIISDKKTSLNITAFDPDRKF
ncbi:MAG: FAD-dependent oxidoreductase [Bacteroidota bacterium]